MARLWESNTNQTARFRVCVAMVTLLVFCAIALKQSQQENVDKRELLASTEIPVEYIDPASIDLTPLMNKLINSTQTGTQHLFSLLSVTSHSSLALHKLTLLVYNISSFQMIDNSMFPMRYCYCLTNRTNDLTDFTAILLDVMGNSTSYLHELFKSSSILSVSQRNSSDCIYICVMAGKTDRNFSQLWDVDSITPVFNQTIIEDSHRGNASHPKFSFEWHHLPSNTALILPSEEHTLHTTTPAPPTTVTMTTSHPTTKSPHTVRAGCPWRSELNLKGNQREDLSESSPTVSPVKLQPCVFELCKFFSQCLCRGYSYKSTLQRYCVDSHRWYETHTEEICRRVRRVAFSKNLKQRCLARMCVKL